MSNSLDPDQDYHSVSPDLGPNCLKRLSADDKSPLARKELVTYDSYKQMTKVVASMERVIKGFK